VPPLPSVAIRDRAIRQRDRIPRSSLGLQNAFHSLRSGGFGWGGGRKDVRSRQCLLSSHCLDWSGGEGRSIRDGDGRLCVSWVLGIFPMLGPGEVLSRGWKHMIV
jgi:hypothetical protein